jgi:hypothetical protein
MANISAVKRILVLFIAVFGLSACGGPPQPTVVYDDDLFSATPCVDRGSWVRVPDSYCPIGDGISNGSYTWAYGPPYRYDAPDVTMVYVGYPVDRTTYVLVRPPRVSTTHLDRGRFPERPAPGQPQTSAATVAVSSGAVQRRADVSRGTSPTRNPDVRRGGLGAPQDRASSAPVPVTSRSAAAPGRGSDSAPAAAKPAGKTAPPAAVPPKPSGSRPVAPPPRKSGK